MIQRCNNPNDPHYDRYGGRGIKVCDKWKNFDAFYADMGPQKTGMTIDRINNDGNYEPSNCRWATRKEQTRNRSNTFTLDALGVSLTLDEWADRTGISREAIRGRLRRGWRAEDAVSNTSTKNI